MAQTSIIPQTIKVKKVIGKEQSKFGKAALVVPVNGKDEFLSLNAGVDESQFESGKTYKVGIAVSKTGKRYVEEILSEEDASPEEAPSPVTSSRSDVQVHSGLDRDVKITYMNIGNVAASLSSGDLGSFKEAFALVEEVYKEKGVL